MIYLYLTTAWLSSGDNQALCWGRQGQDGLELGAGLPAIPPDSVEGLSVIIPAEWVTLLGVTFPGKNQRQFAQAVPYLLEDKLAGEIENLHFAWGAKSATGDIPVAVIDKQRFSALLDKLAKSHIFPVAVFADAQLIPIHTKSAAGLVMGERLLLHVATEAYQALALPLAAASLAIKSWQGRNNAAAIKLYTADAGIAQQCDTGVAIHAETIAEAPHHWLIRQVVEAERDNNPPPVNLLQGGYQPAHRKPASVPLWKILAAAAVILLFCQTTYFLAVGWLFSSQGGKLQNEAIALYRDYFPQDKTVIDPRAQAEGRLQNNRSAGGKGFMATYRRVGAAWKEAGASGAEIQSLRYQNNTLDMDIQAPSVQWVESLIANLQTQGVQGKLLSASQQDQQTAARVRVEAGNG